MLNIKTKLRRAFTIVELVVVIAVIAALAAILIPTFVNVVNNANQASDTSLVNYINTTLATEEAKGNVPDKVDEIYNVTSALNIVADNGVDVTKLDTSANNADFVYNATDNTFLYYTDDFTTLYNGEEPGDDDVLILVASSFDASRVTTAANAGLEVENYCVYCTSGTVTIEGSSEITVWLYGTNNTAFTVDLPNGIVMDYCSEGTVSVTNIAYESYHIYGTYKELSFKYGHLVLESGAKIAKLSILNDNAEEAKTKLTYSADVTIESYYTVSGFTEIYSEDDSETTVSVENFISDLEIEAESVVTIVVSEDGTVSDDTSITGLGTEAYPYLIASEDDYGNVSYDGYYRLTADITATKVLTVEGITAVLDLNGYSITANGSNTINVKGTLTITDNSEKAGYIDNTTSGNKYTLQISATGNLTVEKISIVRTCTSTSYYAVANSGKFTMNSGSITSFTALYSATSTTVTTINGGSIIGTSSYAVYVKAGTVTVEETDADNNPITISGIKQGIYMVEGTVNVYSGTISSSSSSSGYGIYMYNVTDDSAAGEINIYGGTISSGKYGIYLNIADGTLNVSGGEITGSTYGIYSYAGSVITINKGTITGGTTGIYSKGTLIVNDGTITGTKSNGVGINNDSGSVTINGGTISGYCAASFNTALTATGGSGLVNKNSGEITVNSGNISGTWFGIHNNGTLKVYGGEITGGKIGILATGTSTTVTIGTVNGNDGDIVISGSLTYGNSYERAISIKTGATVNIYSGTLNGYYGVSAFGSSSSYRVKLNVYGGKINATAFAICNHGDDKYATINISGGTITSTGSTAVYLPAAYGTTTISGGTIKGTTGVEVRGGSLTITGGSFTATATTFKAVYNGSGSTVEGAALAISTYNQVALTVTISGGTFEGVYSVYECYVNGSYDTAGNALDTVTAPTYAIEITINSGTFNGTKYSQNTSVFSD